MPTALVVDDSDDIRLLIGTVLRSAGYAIVEAPSGRQALGMLAGGALPDIVVLDVQMPLMDGWDTLAAIRARPATVELPVVLCTVKSSAADEARAWQLMCDGFLVKPFELDELVDAVRSATDRSDVEREILRQERLAGARMEMAGERGEAWKSVR